MGFMLKYNFWHLILLNIYFMSPPPPPDPNHRPHPDVKGSAHISSCLTFKEDCFSLFLVKRVKTSSHETDEATIIFYSRGPGLFFCFFFWHLKNRRSLEHLYVCSSNWAGCTRFDFLTMWLYVCACGVGVEMHTEEPEEECFCGVGWG